MFSSVAQLDVQSTRQTPVIEEPRPLPPGSTQSDAGERLPVPELPGSPHLTRDDDTAMVVDGTRENVPEGLAPSGELKAQRPSYDSD